MDLQANAVEGQGTPCFVGVDVGTTSARAGAFDAAGKLLGEASCETLVRSPLPEHFEQSSEDIWQACCKAVRQALAAAGNVQVAGLAFDATCSLVVQGRGGQPLAVGADLPDNPQDASQGSDGLVFDIIQWRDHRATAEAKAINGTRHRLLQHVGGAVSPEMEMPKLKWLKRHKPVTYRNARHFFDLADYLTYRASDGDGVGAGTRSVCTVVCKWNFDMRERSWDYGFLAAIGMTDLDDMRIGTPLDICNVGERVVGGVGQRAAAELGVAPGTPLSVGIIDAHAGGLGCLGAGPPPEEGVPFVGMPPPLAARMALIAGTSACHMASSEAPVFVPGVWGPYDSAMVPGLFLNEGGQSAAGDALDFLVKTHAAYSALDRAAADEGCTHYDMLTSRVTALTKAQGLNDHAFLTAGLFVGPDFNGNRSPLADPCLRGSIVGIGPVGPPEQAVSIDGLAKLYLATIQALAYSTRAIVDAVNVARASAGCQAITALVACGGLAQSMLYLREHANATGLPIFVPPDGSAAVLRGSAMLAATAAHVFPSVADAMRGMGQGGNVLVPNDDPRLRRFHDARYEVFKLMQRHQQEYRALEEKALQTIAPLRTPEDRGALAGLEVSADARAALLQAPMQQAVEVFLTQQEQGYQQTREASFDGSTGPVADAAVMELASNCGHLESLSLTDCEQVTDASVTAIARSCPALQKVQIDGCGRITDTSVMAIAQQCPRLQTAKFSGCRKITDASAVILAQRCTGLQSIDFAMTQITDATVTAMAQNCPGLQTVELAVCGRVTDASVTQLAQHCPSLQYVGLARCPRVSDASVTLLASRCGGLQDLDVACSKISDEGVATVAESRHELRSINLSGCKVSNAAVKALSQHCTGLQSVSLGGCFDVTDDGVAALAQNCPDLRSVSLHRCKITDSCASTLARHCRSLQTVELDTSVWSAAVISQLRAALPQVAVEER